MIAGIHDRRHVPEPRRFAQQIRTEYEKKRCREGSPRLHSEKHKQTVSLQEIGAESALPLLECTKPQKVNGLPDHLLVLHKERVTDRNHKEILHAFDLCVLYGNLAVIIPGDEPRQNWINWVPTGNTHSAARVSMEFFVDG